jgi:hypothetical protein
MELLLRLKRLNGSKIAVDYAAVVNYTILRGV